MRRSACRSAVPACILGDRDQIIRVLVNLLENSLRHTPIGGSVKMGAAKDGENVVIRVTDSGTGIARECLPHVFERFYRVDSARTRAEGGAGLGLAICKGIVEAQGGTIGIESDAGVGTTVTVTLPATKCSD